MGCGLELIMGTRFINKEEKAGTLKKYRKDLSIPDASDVGLMTASISGVRHFGR